MQKNCVSIEYQLSSLSIKGLTNCSIIQAEHNTNAAPILCLHGWLDNSASFLPIMPYLDGVVAVDWPGHGLSSHRSAGAHYHFIDYVYDLLELFESNQWPALNIVAHSMGGMVATMFASAFPEKVKTLTLIDSLGFITDSIENTSINLRKGLLSRLALAKKNQHQKVLNKTKMHANIDAAIKARLQVSDLHYGDAKLLVERGMQAVDDGFVWRSDPRLMTKSPVRLSPTQAQQLIQAINIPVQLIYGDKGMDLVKVGLESYHASFNHFKSTMLAGGHHVHMEQAKATAALINYFINDNS
ncbi:MAG: alpha/beta hydrolase [Alteromonadaceae bacterium]|nr:alpha/beta hydrolase [Alteromonadaceae bacterium]